MATVNIFDMADTWNNVATTYTAIKMNVTDAASASGSLLMDLQVGGSSIFNVTKAGRIYAGGGSGGSPSYSFTAAAGVGMYGSSAGIRFSVSSSALVAIENTNLRLDPSFQFGFASANVTTIATPDLILTRKAAASLRLGAADAASPVAQTLGVQSVVAGTTNTAGANFTITGSQGTGTGAGGRIIFQVAPAGSSGTAQNALVDALTINSAGNLILGSVNQNAYIANPFGYGVELNCVNNNGYWIALNGHSGAFVGNNAPLGWSANTSQTGVDVVLRRDAANILAQRNGTNAQAFRVYNTYTDDSNFERSAFFWNGNLCWLNTSALGTGVARDLAVGPANSARLLLRSNGIDRWQVDASGHFLAGTDNTYDIGASGATRPRNLFVGGGMTTGAPTGGTSGTWKLGVAATVSPTSPNRTIEVDIGGTIYYIHAKTTND